MTDRGAVGSQQDDRGNDVCRIHRQRRADRLRVDAPAHVAALDLQIHRVPQGDRAWVIPGHAAGHHCYIGCFHHTGIQCHCRSQHGSGPACPARSGCGSPTSGAVASAG